MFAKQYKAFEIKQRLNTGNYLRLAYLSSRYKRFVENNSQGVDESPPKWGWWKLYNFLINASKISKSLGVLPVVGNAIKI